MGPNRLRECAPPSETLVIGRVGGPYGIKGWVRLISYADPREAIFEYGTFSSPRGEMVLEQGRPHGKGLVAKFEGVEDRTTAESIRNVDLVIAKSDLPDLENGDYYWHDLVGLQVIGAEGVALGTVRELLATGAHDVLVVAGEDGQKHLIPFVMDEIVQEVDLSSATMRVAWQADY